MCSLQVYLLRVAVLVSHSFPISGVIMIFHFILFILCVLHKLGCVTALGLEIPASDPVESMLSRTDPGI